MQKIFLSILLIALTLGLLSSCSTRDKSKIPITTKSSQARALFEEGMALCDRFHHDEARQCMEEAIEIDPEFALGYLGLACSDLRRGAQYASLQQADDLARPMIRKAPPSILLGVSVLGNEDEGFLGRAGQLLDKVSTAERLWINGLRLSAEGDRSGAVNSFVGLAMMYPQDPLAHRLLGDCYLRFGMPDSAIASYERALAIDSSMAIVYNMLGYEYQAVGRKQDAEQMFAKYAELLPEEPNPQDSYAEFLLRDGRYEESLDLYRKALELDPGFTNSRVGAATDLALMEKYSEALAELDPKMDIARTGQDRLAIEGAKAVTYAYAHDLKKCLTTFKNRGETIDIELEPVDAAYNYDICGEIYAYEGKQRDAEEMFKTSLAIIRSSDLPKAVKEQYEIYHRIRRSIYIDLPAGDVDRAERQLQQLEYKTGTMSDLVTKAALESALHILRGMIAFDQKDYELAADEFKLTRDPSAEVSYYLGMCCEKLGDTEGAADCYRKAMVVRKLLDLPHALYFSKAEAALGRVEPPIA